MQSENDEDESIDDETVAEVGKCNDKMDEANKESSKNHQPEMEPPEADRQSGEETVDQMNHRTNI